MELYMNRFHRMILVGFLMSFVLVNFETRARAQALEVVFKDSLWGAAIGSVVGLASWSLQGCRIRCFYRHGLRCL